MEVPFWTEMVRSGVDPYWVAHAHGYESEHGDATWCFDRLGMTSTVLWDQWVVSIGGEHEDSYDPDFMIYNDVVVRDFRGNVWIYGYPKPDFPPTDFHSATLVSDEAIVIIGGLGYGEDREWWRTPVYSLSLDDMVIQSLPTRGEEPGWIFEHTAVHFPKGRIRLFGGKRIDEDGDTRPNKSEYELDLVSLEWRRL
jgi:hypothetical protein